MVLVLSVIMQNVQRAVIRGHYGVQSSVIIDVADSQSPPHPRLLKNLARLLRNIHETFAGVSGKDHGLSVSKVWKGELDRIQIVSLGDEQILPTIVIVVQKTHAPTGMLHAHETDSRRVAVVFESAIPIVSIECINLAG